MTTRPPDGITMESAHVATLQLTVLTIKAIQIHILSKMRTSQLILLGVPYHNICTIALDQQNMTAQKNGQKILKFTGNKKNDE